MGNRTGEKMNLSQEKESVFTIGEGGHQKYNRRIEKQTCEKREKKIGEIRPWV